MAYLLSINVIDSGDLTSFLLMCLGAMRFSSNLAMHPDSELTESAKVKKSLDSFILMRSMIIFNYLPGSSLSACSNISIIHRQDYFLSKHQIRV